MNKSKKRRFQKGPLPKTPYIAYTLPLYIPYVDDKELLVGVGDKSSDYWANKMLAWTFSIGTSVIAILIIHPSRTTTEYIVFWTIPILLLALGFYYNHKEKTCEPGPFTVFDREKGIVTVPKRWWFPERVFTFNELEAYMVGLGPTRFGAAHYAMNLFPYDPETGEARKSKGMSVMIGPIRSLEDAETQWRFLNRYMDTTQPLPNVPELWNAIMTQWEADHPDATHKEWEQAFITLRHEWAVTMRNAGETQDLGLDPLIDPASPKYNLQRALDDAPESQIDALMRQGDEIEDSITELAQ